MDGWASSQPELTFNLAVRRGGELSSQGQMVPLLSILLLSSLLWGAPDALVLTPVPSWALSQILPHWPEQILFCGKQAHFSGVLSTPGSKQA